MRRMSMAGLAALALVLTATYFCHVPTAAAYGGPRWGANYFPNVELTDQDGNKVHFYDDLIKGKLVAIDLIYTHCTDYCPLETARLVQVQKMLGDRVGKDIFFYSISIDPKRDTPEVLKAYAEKYHVGPGWRFLTGKPEDIDLISKKLGLYSDPDPANRDGHTPAVLFGNDATGQWMQNSATDNPRFLSLMVGQLLDNYKRPDGAPKQSYANAAPLNLDRGRYTFGTHCAACHTVGNGDKIGPDLLGVTNVREHAWLVKFIQTPDKMVQDGDPIATALFKKYKEVRMPNLRLAPDDVEALLKFLADQTKAAAASPAQSSAVPEQKPAEKTASTEPAMTKSERQ